MSLDSLSCALIEQMIRDACAELDARLRRGESLVTEKLLADKPELAANPDNALELVYCEITTREELGNRPQPAELFERFPDWRSRIERLLEVHDAVAAEDRNLSGIETEISARSDQTVIGTSRSGRPDYTSRRRVGAYELLHEIGRGGTGVVYRARQLALGRIVALKLIHSDNVSHEQMMRFHAEAEAAAHLQHPNIVQIYEVGGEDELSYISLELVEGGNLAERLARSVIEPDDAARLMLTIAKAMEYAHERGIVHRDLKPANILLTASGEPKIADFGLAKRSWDHERAKTRAGTILGTPGYMAPEQAVGNNESVGPAADVYAIGAILYELLTGMAPFHAGNLLETLEQVRFLDPVPPRQLRPRLSRDLETICLKCLLKQPQSRYHSAADLAKDLEHYLAREPIRARRVSPLERCAKWVKRRPAIAALTTAVAIVTVVGITGVFWQWSQSEQRRGELEKAFGEIKLARTEEAKQREKLKGMLYLQRVAAAYGEWLANHPARAEQLLEQCEPELKGWEWRYLDRLLHAEQRTMSGHTLAVRGVAVSPDGRLIATSSGAWGYSIPGEIIIWDAETGQQLHVLGGHTGPVNKIAFSPDGKRLASVGGFWSTTTNGELILWDPTTGERLQKVKGPLGVLTDVAFSRDGKWIAASSGMALAQVWHADTCEEYRLFTGHTSDVFCVGFSPDSSIFATGSRDSTVRLWNLKTGELLESLVPGFDVRAMAISPSGNRLAAATWNGVLKVWELSPGAEVLTRQIGQHQLLSERINALQFSPDDETLAIACTDGSMRIWHPVNGAELRHFRAHSGSVHNLAFFPEGDRIVTSGNDREVKCWDLTADHEPMTFFPHSAQISAIAFSPDGQQLAIAGGENRHNLGVGKKTLHIWDFSKRISSKVLTGHTGWLTSVAYSPKGDLIVSGDKEKQAILWDPKGEDPKFFLKGHAGAVTGVAFHPAGNQVATSSADHTVKLWDTSTGDEIATLVGHEDAVTAVAYSPQGEFLVTSSEDATVRVWDAAERKTIATLNGHNAAVSDVVFSPKGMMIASCGVDAQVIVWQPEKTAQVDTEWKPRMQLQYENRWRIKQLAFHPDCDRLAGISEDGSLFLWDIVTGEEAFSRRGGSETLMDGDITFSPNGEQLAASYTATLILHTVRGRSYGPPDPVRLSSWHENNAMACAEDKNWTGARFHYDRLLAMEPNNWMIHFRRGDSFASQEEWEPADKAYASAATILQSIGTPSDKLSLLISERYRRSAEIEYNFDRTKRAAEMLQQATAVIEKILASSPNDVFCRRELAVITSQLARTYKDVQPSDARKAYELSIVQWDQVRNLQANVADDQVNLANSLINLAVMVPLDQREPLYRRAMALLEPAVQDYPKNRRYRFELALCMDDFGWWLESKDQHEEAERLVRRALDVRSQLVLENPNDNSYLKYLARSYDRLSILTYYTDRMDEAKVFWRGYLQSFDDYLSGLPAGQLSGSDANTISWYWATCPFPDLRNPERAVEWGKKAVKLRPQDGNTRNTLGAAHYRNGEFETAKKLLTQSMEMREGGDSFDWLFLAMVEWQLGHPEQAKDWLARSEKWTQENRPKDAPLLRIQKEAQQLIAAAEQPK